MVKELSELLIEKFILVSTGLAPLLGSFAFENDLVAQGLEKMAPIVQILQAIDAPPRRCSPAYSADLAIDVQDLHPDAQSTPNPFAGCRDIQRNGVPFDQQRHGHP